MWGSVSTPCSFKIIHTMKIDRLYKLSQFVDYVTNNARITDDSLIYIKEYNDFLKQPIKKEMFVNEILCPDAQDYNTESEYETDLKAWQEAEKKIIFDCYFRENGNVFEIDKIEYVNSEFDSLGSLSTMTNGNLKLKNVEL